jgi:hypothetical protein
MKTNLCELTEVLDEIEFFKRKRRDRQYVELAILLYNHRVSLRKVARALSWIGVERSDVAVWMWIQKFGRQSCCSTRRWSNSAARSSRCLYQSIPTHGICCMPLWHRRETT